MAAAMEKKSFHPGAAPFGNFINYYSFNPVENRIKLMQDKLVKEITNQNESLPMLALDIGCNCGDLTVGLYNYLKDSKNQHSTDGKERKDFHFLGCDIDDSLIQRANESNPHPDNINFKTLDVMNKEMCESLFSDYLSQQNMEQFNIIFCFSITMWIHLQNGDSGLEEFLTRVSKWTEYLVIEPQPWKCYRSAVRRVAKLKLGDEYFPHFKSLTVRSNVVEYIDKFLSDKCDMELLDCFGETDWERKLLLYKKKK
ncbi:pre-miRNA 5'-monophosphate methyltransferase-like [Glandiceps talaboti]